MTAVSCIVEGHGEVASLPILLRRISAWRSPALHIEIPQPIRVPRDRFLNRTDEFTRHLELAAKKSGDEGWILILLDADDDCPRALGQHLIERSRNCLPHRMISVVLANREFEAWFIGAAQSLNGKRGFLCESNDHHEEAERRRDAKGWIRERMSGKSYGETTDQPAFTSAMDLQQAFDHCRSFRKLCTEWDRLAAHAA